MQSVHEHSILIAHNFYNEPGGEDRVFLMESELLQQNGHRVIQYRDRNDRIRNGSLTSAAAIWNQRTYHNISRLARSKKPDVAHFHNTFPLISPAGYYALGRLGIPIIQTLSNFRLLCPGGLLLRNGVPCEDCITRKSFLPAICHACYRESHAGTAAVATMLALHRVAGTWRDRVDLYLALSNFARTKFIEEGFPPDRVLVKQNFLAPDPGQGPGDGDYALFVGRLSAEKGITTLAEAWHSIPEIPLQVVGAGPLDRIDWPANVSILGHQSPDRVIELMKRAALLIFPSICYENAPVTILEALACGLPIIASSRGSIPEMVETGVTGLLFEAGEPADLARKVRSAIENPELMRRMRSRARLEFIQKYTAERNYKRLLEAYEMAAENSRRRLGARRRYSAVLSANRSKP
jgi:glycosyltransferase involved in cell wall biosynthesis